MQILDACCDICNPGDNVYTAFPQRLVNAHEHVQMQLTNECEKNPMHELSDNRYALCFHLKPKY